MRSAMDVLTELWPREVQWQWLQDAGDGVVLYGYRNGREAQRTIEWSLLATGRYGMSPLFDAANEIYRELVPLTMPLLWEGDNA